MNWSAGKIGTISKGSARANGLSTPPIGCVLHLPGLPGGGSKIYDRSPYGNVGTITGATWTRLPSGLWVLSFDGTDDYITNASPSGLNGNTELSILMWVKLKTIGARQFFTIWGNRTYHQAICFEIGAGDNWKFHLYDQGAVDTTIPTANTTDYVFLAGIYDKSNTIIYTNGAYRDSTGYSAANIVQGPFFMGALDATSLRVNGYIALFRIYNRALSALEIQNHFNREKHLFGVW